jgi:hypothetical protein
MSRRQDTLPLAPFRSSRSPLSLRKDPAPLLSQHSIARVSVVAHLHAAGIADHVGRQAHHLLIDVQWLTTFGTLAVLIVDLHLKSAPRLSISSRSLSDRFAQTLRFWSAADLRASALMTLGSTQVRSFRGRTFARSYVRSVSFRRSSSLSGLIASQTLSCASSIVFSNSARRWSSRYFRWP